MHGGDIHICEGMTWCIRRLKDTWASRASRFHSGKLQTETSVPGASASRCPSAPSSTKSSQKALGLPSWMSKKTSSAVTHMPNPKTSIFSEPQTPNPQPQNLKPLNPSKTILGSDASSALRRRATASELGFQAILAYGSRFRV